MSASSEAFAVLPTFSTLMRIRHARGCCSAAPALVVFTDTATITEA